jgi:V/A-type H+-transporting ATPase subunit E
LAAVTQKLQKAGKNMNGIENIIAHLEKDTAETIENIRAEAGRNCDKIRTDCEKEAKDAYWKRIQVGTQEAEMRISRLSSIASLEARKQILSLKQEMVNQAFDRAMERFEQLPEEQYVQFLTTLAVKGTRSGNEQLVFSAKDRSRIGKTVCINANNALANQGKNAGLTLSEKTCDIRAGLILVEGKIDINCSVETMIMQKKHELAAKVADILFS